MGYDFSELDAELAALGNVPANVAELARSFAGVELSLAAVDRALEALGAQVSVPVSVPPVRPAPSAEDSSDALTRSGEIALPDPVPTNEAPDSGELALDAPSPRSGSYALSDIDDDSDDDFEAEFAALAAPDALLSPPRTSSAPPASGAEEAPAPAEASPPAALREEEPREAVAREAEPFEPFPHEEEAHDEEAREVAEPASSDEHGANGAALSEDEDPEPLLALFDADLPEDTEVSAAVPLAHLVEPAAPRSTALRDPDAEFDALFEEATSPSAIPPGPEALEDEGDNVDDLLRDLTSQPAPPPTSEPPKAAQSTAAAPASSSPLQAEALFDDEDLDDPTHVVDRAALGSLRQPLEQSDNPFPAEEELPSAEFEILIDEDEDEVAKTVPPRSPPPPPPPSGADKRPSFLGRLFGPKKD